MMVGTCMWMEISLECHLTTNYPYLFHHFQATFMGIWTNLAHCAVQLSRGCENMQTILSFFFQKKNANNSIIFFEYHRKMCLVVQQKGGKREIRKVISTYCGGSFTWFNCINSNFRVFISYTTCKFSTLDEFSWMGVSCDVDIESWYCDSLRFTWHKLILYVETQYGH